MTRRLSEDERYAKLLAKRVPREDIVPGRAYVIHARNGGVGVAVEEDGHLGYRLCRQKFGKTFLFVEFDCEDNYFPTAIPLHEIPEDPPEGAGLLEWLGSKEGEYGEMIDGAWDVVLGTHNSARKEGETT